MIRWKTWLGYHILVSGDGPLFYNQRIDCCFILLIFLFSCSSWYTHVKGTSFILSLDHLLVPSIWFSLIGKCSIVFRNAMNVQIAVSIECLTGLTYDWWIACPHDLHLTPETLWWEKVLVTFTSLWIFIQSLEWLFGNEIGDALLQSSSWFYLCWLNWHMCLSVLLHQPLHSFPLCSKSWLQVWSMISVEERLPPAGRHTDVWQVRSQSESVLSISDMLLMDDRMLSINICYSESRSDWFVA